MKKLIILTALVLLGACQPKKQPVKANTSAATIGGMQLGANCAATATQVQPGSIFDNSTQSFGFEQRVKDLLSAYLQPSEVGSVSAYQSSPGVWFSGAVKLDASGNVVAQNSNVMIEVKDSYYNMNPQNPIQMKFSQASGATISGQFNTSTGVGSLILKDNYGQIKFDGTISAEKFSGTVSFQNSQTVTGGAPASGTLGQFWVNTCGFLQ